MGHQKGEYQYLNPNDHVNKCQSTNDAYPTGFRIAVYASILKLIDAIKQLGEGFRGRKPWSSRTSSKWAAPSCRTRCR